MILLSAPQSPANAAEVRAKAAAWLATDYALTHWELSYHRLPRRIIFDEFLGNPPDTPNDYKFYVIHRKVRLITVDAGRFTRHVRDAFLPDWTPLRSQIGHSPISEVPLAPPARLGAMSAVAERLAADTDFVRVDLYEYRGAVYFGELTNSPGAGFPHICDARLDRSLGDCWQLPRRYTERMFMPAGRARRAGWAPRLAGAPDALLRVS